VPRTRTKAYDYLTKMNAALSEAWEDYNRGIALCEMYVFDGCLSGRRLFFSCLCKACKRVKKTFEKVVKGAVKVVTVVIVVVVEVVTELVEYGVGIVTQGAICGLIGCAFGLYGVAAGIAFILATGGLNNEAGALCSAQEAIIDADDAKKEKGKVFEAVMNGVGVAVCEINKKLDSSLLL